jgi:hypothetical protein
VACETSTVIQMFFQETNKLMGRKHINGHGSAVNRVVYLDGHSRPRCRIRPKGFPSLDERSAAEHPLGVIFIIVP